MKAKTAVLAKKVLRQVPPRAIEAGAALIISKTVNKGKSKAAKVATAISVIVITHYVIDWASKD